MRPGGGGNEYGESRLEDVICASDARLYEPQGSISQFAQPTSLPKLSNVIREQGSHTQALFPSRYIQSG